MGLLEYMIAVLLTMAFYRTPTVCGNAELRALMEIKTSLDPENKHLTSWIMEGDPCSGSFMGVVCNEHLKVANISLQGKGLSGKISPAVAELKCLSGLYLHYNSISGEIPKEIANLTELVDLYLDVNNLSGLIPAEIANMASLQVFQLCCNQLTGIIPINIGSIKKLNVLALQHNRLNGSIPSSLGKLEFLERLDLGFNNFSGPIPATLANISSLKLLNVENNSLSGAVPPALKRLVNGGLNVKNNPRLCGVGLRVCTSLDHRPEDPIAGNVDDPSFHVNCNDKDKTHCRHSLNISQIIVMSCVSFVSVSLVVAIFLVFLKFSRKKQKIENTASIGSPEFSRSQPPVEEEEEEEVLNGFKFNLEDVESATQYFSDLNLLGKSSFSTVYKGTLKNGSNVAIKSISGNCCKSEEAELMKGLSLLTSLRNDNLVRLRGFCYSKGRVQCFLIYDFAANGNLSNYLDGSRFILDWPTRVHIINGIAKGIGYLHKSAIVHQNISVEKILLDGSFNPLLMDSGLLKLLADDVIFSALKASAALGYMAPEYVTTGRFTEKSDVYAFGVIILQILSGKRKLTNMMRVAAESSRLEDFVDPNLKASILNSEAAKLTEIALFCTHEVPDKRPSIHTVIQELYSK